MLPNAREMTFTEPISRMGLDNSQTGLYIATDSKDLHKIDLRSLELKKSISLSNLHEAVPFDYYKRPFALRDTLLYVEFSTSGKEYILEIKDKVKKRLSLEQNAKSQVTKARFSEDGTLLVTGNERGFTYVIDTKSGDLIAEFEKNADSICAVAISPTNFFAARASFDGSLLVMDIGSMESESIDIPDTIIEMMEFIDERTLLAITRDARILKIDILDKSIKQEESFGQGVWPSELCLSHSKKFAYVGTRDSRLYVFHTNTLQNYYSVDFKRSGITAMLRTPRFFIIGFQSGEVVYYNHRQYEDKFVLAVKLKNMQEAISYFEKNIFLMSHRETKGIYEFWVEKKQSISNLLANGNIEEAEQQAKAFLFHPKCASEFDELEALQPELMALNRYVRSKSYKAAYELAERNPALKSYAVYQRLEKIWMETLQKAQITLSRDPVLNKDQAKYILRPFRDVDVKEMVISKMLSNASSFARAINAVKNKNFSLYFKLVEQYDFLVYAPLYKRVHALAEKVQNEAITLLKNEEYMKAMEKAKALAAFTPYVSKSKYLEKFANGLVMIEYHLEHGSLLEAMKIKDGLRMQGSYTPLVKLEAKKDAFQKKVLLKIRAGDIEGIYEYIEPFFKLDTCKKEIAMIMKYLYIEQMSQHAKNFSKKEIWTRILKNYFSYFRMDKALIEFLQKHDLKELAKDIAQETTPKASKFVANITLADL